MHKLVAIERVVTWLWTAIILIALLIVVKEANAVEPTAEIKANIAVLSQMYGIEPTLIQAIVKVESGYKKHKAGSSHKERGLMQLHPKYFPKAKFDVATNLRAGVKYLAKVRELCYPKYADAWIVCYNLGPNHKRLKRPTQFAYYRKVMHAKKQIEEKQVYARNIAQSEG